MGGAYRDLAAATPTDPGFRTPPAPDLPALDLPALDLPALDLPALDLPAAPAAEYGPAFPAAPEAPARRPGEPVDAGADLANAAVLARQVEAARRHLQAAVLVAHDTAGSSRMDGLLSAVEQALSALTGLARETREVLPRDVYDRTFPGEARFLCATPWERTALVSPDPYEPEPASPTGLARLLEALGYEAHAVTATSGVAGVQVRTERYSAHIALVEPAGGGRQRWSGALEWTDPNGVTRTWAETLGPVELDEEELARRVDELLRRCVGPHP
jgi:hypothetical protein